MPTRPPAAGTKRIRGAVLALSLSVPLMAWGAARAPAGEAAAATAHRDHRAASSAQTQTVRWHDSAGTSRTGTVTVSKTQQLSSREIVSVSWKGFLPTEQQDGVESTHQAPQAPTRSAYPVVILECQGGDPETITPEDCPLPQRFYYFSTQDALESEEVRSSSAYDSQPFRDTSGKLHTAPGVYQSVPMPSDYSDSNVIGTNWYATWTEDDGSRDEAKFEVRSTKEAPQSLGCADPSTREHGTCSIVVVPIRPMHCVDATSCTPPQETNGYSASYLQWQSASNWQNKFVFPVTFKPFPDVCDLDSRPTVPTMGSQLLNEAMLSWVPTFCQSRELFKLGFTRTNDSAARAALTTGVAGQFQSDLAFTTKPAESTTERPVVNAPVAVTGFDVAFALDDKDFEEVDSMRLDARLLAKLVTESYYAPPVPYLAKNPSDLLHDPEFRKLNPQLVKQLDPYVEIDNPVLVQGNPDLVSEVTRYIASDPEAVAWLNGKPDPWGMKVNPHYQGKQWPVPNDQFEMRDPWTDTSSSTDKCEPKPVMQKAAQFVYDVMSATVALVDRQPQNYGVCKVSGQGGDVWAWSRPDRQPLGQRAMIAITDAAAAAQYQLPSAELRTRAGTFVGPTPSSLAAAVEVATLDRSTQTILADMRSSSKTAYPGMMAVYAAAPTHGLSTSEAASYAEMIRWMATTGQEYGDAAGKLPQGYLALPRSMRAQALAAANHVARQDSFGAVPSHTSPTSAPPTSSAPATSSGPPTSAPTSVSPSPGTGQGGLPTGVPGSSTVDVPSTGDAPTSVPATTPAAAPTPTVATEPVATVAQSSALADNALPILLVVTIGGLIMSPLLLMSGRISSLGGLRSYARRRFGRGGRS